jgi:hypothetical protein
VIEPLRLSYEIDCPAEHAFDVWTRRLSTWWPKDHSASGDPDTVVVLEPRLGGRIYERTPDGTEIDWGEITLWSDENKVAKDGTLEAWARSETNPVGGWYGLRKGYRAASPLYVPPLLEHLGLVELEHNPRNNRVRGR